MANGARKWDVTVSSLNAEGRFALAKVWFKDHDIEFEVKNHYCVSSWQTATAQLTVDQMGKLALYLQKAELFSEFKL